MRLDDKLISPVKKNHFYISPILIIMDALFPCDYDVSLMWSSGTPMIV